MSTIYGVKDKSRSLLVVEKIYFFASADFSQAAFFFRKLIPFFVIDGGERIYFDLNDGQNQVRG